GRPALTTITSGEYPPLTVTLISCTPEPATVARTASRAPKKYHRTKATAPAPRRATMISLVSMAGLPDHAARNRRSRRLLATTETLEKLIAALAMMGERSTPVKG